jgi:glycosyltransferase involved in cell wall biosynthesis
MAPRSPIRVERADNLGAAPPLTILQIVAPGEVGGLESVVLALSAGLARRGHKVIVAVVSDRESGNHPFAVALKAAGVRAVTFTVPAHAYLKERALIKGLCDREKPDVVHTHGYRPDILHAASRIRRKFATVTTLHGSSKVGGRSTFHEAVQLFLLRRFDAVIAVSRELAKTLRGRRVAPERLHVVRNAWNASLPVASRAEARRFLGLPDGAVVVGWIGRLIPVKGADVFLNALRQLSSLPFVVSVIGDGPERARLETLARDAGMSDRVRFHGAVAGAARFMGAFDVFVLSSRSEGTPVTLLEAMGARVPVVVTGVGGVPDVVGAEEGVLVPPEDPVALARGIRSVIEDPVGAQLRVDAAARKLASDFEIESWIDAHEAIYDLAASGHARSSL